MKNIKGFCDYCQKETSMRAVVTAFINSKKYFVVNCEICGRGAYHVYRVMDNIWKTDFNLKQAEKIV